MTLNEIATAAHHLMASLIQTIHQMIKKHPQNGSSMATSTLLLAAGQQGKLMKPQFGQLWSSSKYRLFLFLCTAWKVFTSQQLNPTGNYWTAYSRLCTGELTSVERMDRCNCVSSRAEFRKMFILDTQEKIDPRNTDWFLLNHGKLRGFQVHALSGWTICGMTAKTWSNSQEANSRKRKGPANCQMWSNICQSAAISNSGQAWRPCTIELY